MRSWTYFNVVCKLRYNLHWCSDQVPTFEITETNLHVPVVTLSTQDNAKLLPQLKSDLKRTISWNKYLPKPELLPQNPNLNHLVEPSFQGVNRLFVLAFEEDTQRTSNKKILNSKCRNKRLPCYEWWKKLFWSTSKK